MFANTAQRLLRAAVVATMVAAAPVVHAGGADHLAAARDLVARVALAHTRYEHGQGTVDFGASPSSYTDCSGLIDHLLMHTYGYTPADFKRWFNSTRPSARRYYDAFVEGTGFSRVERIADIRPGDFIAIKYLTRTDNTGHIMVVDQMAERAPRNARSSGESHGDAWLVTVIDSAESGHGPTDTRHKLGENGRDHEGIGRGALRLFADGQGRVAGFSWSSLNSSEFKGPETEPVAIGRLVPGFKP